MVHGGIPLNCRGAGTFARHKQLHSSTELRCSAVHVGPFDGMAVCGSKGIVGEMQVEKSVILLKAFYAQYPNIRKEIAQFMLDHPGESVLKEFLWEIMNETQGKGE